MEYPMLDQIALKCLTHIRTSQITVKNNFLYIFSIQTGILYRLYCQLRCHGCVIIPDNLAAAQVHHGGQISPAFFLHMDVGNICTPFLLDVFCLKITFRDISFVIWDSSVVCMVIIFLPRQTLSPVVLYAFGHAFGCMVSHCH